MPEHVESSPFTKSFWALLLGFIGYACRLAVTVILTHHLSLELYGDFTVAWRTLVFVSLMLTFGSAISARRFVSDYVLAKDQRKQSGFTLWIFGLLRRSTIRLVVAYALFWFMTNILHIIDIRWIEKYHLAVFVVILAPVLSVFSIICSYILSHGYGLLSAFLNSVVFYGAQLFVIVVFFSVLVPDSITHLSYLLFFTVFFLLMISAVIALSIPDMDILKTLLAPRRERFYDREWIDDAEAAYLNEIVFRMTFTLNLYLLEIFSPLESHVGILSVCETWAGVISLVLVCVNLQSISGVHLLGHLTKPFYAQMQRHLDLFNVFKLLLSLGFALFTWYYRELILVFFNIHDTSAGILLPWMIFNAYLGDNRYQFTLLMSKHEAHFVQNTQIASIILLLVVGTILVIPYGMFGVTTATTLSRVLSKIVLTYRCRQLSPMRFNLIG
jgi:O-antigen/teichoic acid export membrane protein